MFEICVNSVGGSGSRLGAVVGVAFKDMVPFVLARRVERQEPGPFRGPPSQISLHAGPLLAPGVSGGRGCR